NRSCGGRRIRRPFGTARRRPRTDPCPVTGRSALTHPSVRHPSTCALGRARLPATGRVRRSERTGWRSSGNRCPTIPEVVDLAVVEVVTFCEHSDGEQSGHIAQTPAGPVAGEHRIVVVLEEVLAHGCEDLRSTCSPRLARRRR